MKRTIDKLKANSKVFFSFAKKHKISVSSFRPNVDENDMLKSSTKDMVEILQRQYCSAFSNRDMINVNSITESKPEYKMCNIAFAVSDIAAICKLTIGYLQFQRDYPLKFRRIDATTTLFTRKFSVYHSSFQMSSNSQVVNYNLNSSNSHLILQIELCGQG